MKDLPCSDHTNGRNYRDEETYYLDRMDHCSSSMTNGNRKTPTNELVFLSNVVVNLARLWNSNIWGENRR